MIAQKVYTTEDFILFIERMSDARFEFVGGKIIPLYENEPLEESFIDYVLSPDFDEKQITKTFTKPTKIHDLIVSNLHGNLFNFCKGKSYRVYSQATSVFIDWSENWRIPDLVVVGKESEERNKSHQLLNPILMFEVLSKSTQAKDKSEKLEEYQSLETLEEYVMVSQFEPKVIIYRKLNPNKWEQEIISGLSNSVELKSLHWTLNLNDIFDEVNFEEKEETKP